MLLVAAWVGLAGNSLAAHHKVTMLDATVCSDNPSVQNVRVELDKEGEHLWANCIELQFLDASASEVSSFVVSDDVPPGEGVVVEIGTAEFAAASGTPLDVIIPSGNIMPSNGQVCYHGLKESNEFDCKSIDLCIDVTAVSCGGSVCGNGIVEAGEQCDDGGTQAGSCCSPTCQFESAATQCRSSVGSCDVAEFCDGSSSACPTDLFDPGLCDDGSFCTVGRACVAGTCTSGSPRDCSAAGDQCNSGTCNEGIDACEPQPVNEGGTCSDGNASTVADVCSAGVCAGTDLCAGVVCGASDQCHVAGTCDVATGLCNDPASPDDTVCDDGNASTTKDQCSAGVCAGIDLCEGVICSEMDQCHVAGTCDPITGLCSTPMQPNGTTCDDGRLETLDDQCTVGVCAGIDLCDGIVCPPAGPCHEVGTCDSLTGACSSALLPDGTTCEDGAFCNGSETCTAGVCSADAGSICGGSAPVCDEAIASCVECLTRSDCAAGDTCLSGVCQPMPLVPAASPGYRVLLGFALCTTAYVSMPRRRR
ncbi:MAG: hypothetical protein VCC20_16360 [Myxococcota bacterium]